MKDQKVEMIGLLKGLIENISRDDVEVLGGEIIYSSIPHKINDGMRVRFKPNPFCDISVTINTRKVKAADLGMEAKELQEDIET